MDIGMKLYETFKKKHVQGFFKESQLTPRIISC